MTRQDIAAVFHAVDTTMDEVTKPYKNPSELRKFMRNSAQLFYIRFMTRDIKFTVREDKCLEIYCPDKFKIVH